MIYVKLISGLGNQLFQYALGRQLSLKHKVPLKLDVSFFETQSLRTYRLNKYNIQADLATAEELDDVIGIYADHGIVSRIKRKVERNLPKHMSRLYKQSGPWVFEPEVFKTGRTVYLDGYWQHYKYFQDFPAAILDELSVAETADASFESLLQQIKSTENSVSVHIRRSDYVTDSEANRMMGVMPLSYYYNAINTIREKTGNPVFFIFSDHLDWVKENLRIEDKVVYIDYANGEKEYLELQLMSTCRHNIIANSSFSWWGAFLNRSPDKIIVAPQQWVASPELNANVELQFPAWIKM